MLSNLDWLKENQEFPPLSEQERIERYQKNIDIFENKHSEVYASQFERIQQVIGNFDDVVSYPVILNFQKKMSLKTADFLFVEPPIVTIKGKDDDLKKFIEDNDLWNNAYEVAIDCSRAGTGLFFIKTDKEQNKTVSLTQPQFWYPIVSPYDIKEVKQHVLAWKYVENELEFLLVRIHNKGNYEERTYKMEQGTIGKMVGAPKVIQTGLTDFAVIPIHNLTTSNKECGIDDYEDIDSIIAELMVRISQIAKVLDAHAAPSMEGSEASLERDPITGAWHMKMGKFFVRDNKEEPETKYITWDANLDSSFQQIDKLINFLAIISEMGPAIFDDGEKMGQAASGTALRFRFINVLAKVTRLRNHFDTGLKKLFKLIYGEETEISIVWQDGLPADPKEAADIANTRTGGKATQSQKRALMQLDNLNETEADKQIEEIREDDALDNPMSNNLGTNNPLDEGDTEGDTEGSGLTSGKQKVKDKGNI